MVKKKLKIAIFHLAFLYSGGGERLVLEEAIRLKKLGHSVTCYTPAFDEQKCFPELMKKVELRRILPRILPGWYPDSALLSILATCVLTPLFFYKFRKYDIYFGANQPGPWIAFLLSIINRKPYAIYLAQPTRLIHPRLIDQQVGLRLLFGFSMLNILTNVFRPFIWLFDFVSIKNATTVFANGTYARGLLEEVYRIKATNCPAGSKKQIRITKDMISNRFRGEEVLNQIKIKKPYILITNRHFPHKKFEYGLEAFQKLKRKKLSLVIAGQETDYTKHLKANYLKDKRIYFVGLLSEKDLHSAYQQASVYIYPAPEEDFGMGIIEAMSYGVPVVAWGNAGPTGIIKHGYDGFLAKPFDTDSFSFYIHSLLRNRSTYEKVAINSQEKITKHFSYAKHIKILSIGFKKTIVLWKKGFSDKKIFKKRRILTGALERLDISRISVGNIHIRK